MTHVHHHVRASSNKQEPTSFWPLAFSATWHCLLGCGLGEVAGMLISAGLNLSNLASFVLSDSLGFVFGLVLGIRPWLKQGLTFRKAAWQVILVEGLSIVIMELAETLVEMYTPGVMNAHLGEPILWIGLFLALIAGFIAALPINYLLASRGIRHQH